MRTYNFVQQIKRSENIRGTKTIVTVKLRGLCTILMLLFCMALFSCCTLFMLHCYAWIFSEQVFYRKLPSDCLFFMCCVRAVIKNSIDVLLVTYCFDFYVRRPDFLEAKMGTINGKIHKIYYWSKSFNF